MAWQVVAEGTNLEDLKQTIADRELPKGTKVKVVMDLKMPVAWAFDVAGAEWVFKPFVPEGMELIDVYGEGNQGFVEMEADPIWLVAMLGFIKAHWLAIIIAGFVLTVIIAFIRIIADIVTVPGLAWIWVAAGILAVAYGSRGKSIRSPP